jgi:hypothetical protein
MSLWEVKEEGRQAGSELVANSSREARSSRAARFTLNRRGTRRQVFLKQGTEFGAIYFKRRLRFSATPESICEGEIRG